MIRRATTTAAALAAAWPTDAAAHAFAASDGLIAGLAHPIGGWDHLTAMILVGALSTRLAPRDLWRLPACFVTAMAAGGLVGLWSAPLPSTEFGIRMSVVVLGLLLAAPRLRAIPAYGTVAAFAWLHGYAHGIEAPAPASAALYVAGFVAATVALHLVGMFAALLAREARFGAVALPTAGLFAALFGAAALVVEVRF